MAWSRNVDERYGGGLLAFSAGELDASNLLNEAAVLAEGVVGYGYSTDDYLTADIDVYSLGILSAGTYSLDVDSNTWDFFSLDFGSPSEFGIYDQFGLLVANSFSTFTDVEFSVSNSSTYYAYVKGPIFGTAQYSIVYDEVVTTNSPAIFSNPTYVGTLQAGTSVTALALYLDLDGNSDNTVLTGWFLDDGDVSNGYEAALTDYASFDGSIELSADWVGKTLHFFKSFEDDAGNLEISQIWEIGEITQVNQPAVFSNANLSTPHSLGTELTASVDIDDADGITSSTPNYSWYRYDKASKTYTFITDQSANYTVQSDDIGHSIWFDVSFVDDEGNAERSEKYGSKDNIILPEASPHPIASTFPLSETVFDSWTNGSKWIFPDGVDRVLDWGLVEEDVGDWSIAGDTAAVWINLALQSIGQFIGITFNYTGLYHSAQEATNDGVELSYSLSTLPDNVFARAHFPNLDLSSFIESGDVLLSGQKYWNLPALSLDEQLDFVFLVLHETGHALGLKHPHDSGGTGRPIWGDTNHYDGIVDLDDIRYTVMSYDNGTDSATSASSYALTPMIFDILALQYLYGKPPVGESVDDFYDYDTAFENFDLFALFYDIGGEDTLSAASLNESQTIVCNFNVGDLFASYFERTTDGLLESFVGTVGDGIEMFEGSAEADTFYDWCGVQTVLYEIADFEPLPTLTNSLIDGKSGDDRLILQSKLISDLVDVSPIDGGYSLAWTDYTLDLKSVEVVNDYSNAEYSIQDLFAAFGSELSTPPMVDISSFDGQIWATESESLGVVVGTSSADQIMVTNELAGQQTHASVFVGDGDDTVADSSGDDFIMFGSGADTLNTSSGADLIYKAGSGSLTINASPDGVWGHGYYAQNVGLANSIGTENLISLAGLNRFHDTLARGDSQIDVTVNASLPTNATTGLAVFTEDVFSPRHADVNPIAQFFTDSDIEIPAGLRSFSSVTHESGASFTINGSEFGDLFDFTTELITAGSPIDGYQINYFGHGGDDVIWGSAFANINGGAGDDIINGGYGDNTLTGGSGSDIFEFTATSGNDTITDFNKDEDELHFYFREGEAEESAVASINNGVVTWDAVTVDLGDSSLAISDLNITYEMI